jgi:hypothetical protein
MYFYCYDYVFSLYVYGWLLWLRFFPAFSSVVRQMPGYTSQRRGTVRTLPNFCVVLCIFVLFYVFLCCSMYCVFCIILCIVLCRSMYFLCSMYFCVVLCIFVLFYIVCFVSFYVFFSKYFMLFYVFLCCSIYCLFCVILCIFCFVSFYVFVSKYFYVVLCIVVLFYVLFVLCRSMYFF